MSQQPVGFRPARGGTWCWFVVAGNWICFYCNLPNRPFNYSNGNHWNKNITLIQKVDNNTVVFTKSPFEICSPKSISCFQMYSCFIPKHLHQHSQWGQERLVISLSLINSIDTQTQVWECHSSTEAWGPSPQPSVWLPPPSQPQRLNLDVQGCWGVRRWWWRLWFRPRPS